MTEWTKERQQEAFQRHAGIAYDEIVQWLIDNKDEVIAEAEARMFGIGYDQYGDASFRLTHEQLQQGKLEECSDALVYQVIDRTKERAEAWTHVKSDEHSPLGRARMHYRVATIPDSPDD